MKYIANAPRIYLDEADNLDTPDDWPEGIPGQLYLGVNAENWSSNDNWDIPALIKRNSTGFPIRP